jgi:predicted nuclease with TOPRIM domain
MPCPRQPATSLNTILPPLPVLDPLPEDTHAPDSPTLSLIAALRQQISILTDQSTELNTKLIRQLERASDLEDNLEHKRHAEKEKDDLIAKLEGEKAQWEENMNTGLLVERGTVREEMQRLVEGLVEEEKRRGSAERGREQVEQEINDLTGTLFEQVSRRGGTLTAHEQVC